MTQPQPTLAYARSHTVEETASALQQQVTLVGWVQRRRDLGSIVFIDLRDRTGLVQLVFDLGRGTSEAAMVVAGQIRSEYVIAVTGQVVARAQSAVNPRLATGEIEVAVANAEVLNAAKTPPFYIQDGIEADESVRLRYRYLDLRRPEVQQIFKLRHRVFRAFRDYLDDHAYTEIETPILTKSTPEGARDYVVPSRLEPGAFYALPQSPQIFKQLLMVAGMERYYQFARCFRDEDLRADRQPEFTQLDIETSFLSQDDLLTEMEKMFSHVFQDTLGVHVQTPFQRLTYEQATETYGSDKPDLRFGLPIVDIGEAVQDASFKVFAQTLAAGGVVKAIVAPGCADYSRKQTDALTQFVAKFGLKGLAPIAVQEASFRSPIAKFFSAAQLDDIVQKTGAQVGDLILIAAAPRKTALAALGALRAKLGAELRLIDEDAFSFLWIVDFPLFSYDEEADHFVAEHHPFTMPKVEDIDLLDSDLGAVRAQAYDLVLNGFELSSGSMRIYQRDIQERMFKALGYSPEEAYEKFGFLLDAFEYGTPPHGGIAFGLDRIIMIMSKSKSLRDVVAFPKTSSAADAMTHAPDSISDEQLRILGINIQKKDAPQ